MQDTQSTYKNQFYFFIVAIYNQKFNILNTTYTSIKNTKYLGINMVKDVKDLVWETKLLLSLGKKHLKIEIPCS